MTLYADPSGSAVYGVALRPFACWECGFESRQGHGCLSLLSVVWCQIEVSASGWSLVQSSPTECGVSECDGEPSIMRRPDPLGAVAQWKWCYADYTAKWPVNLRLRWLLKAKICKYTGSDQMPVEQIQARRRAVSNSLIVCGIRTGSSKSLYLFKGKVRIQAVISVLPTTYKKYYASFFRQDLLHNM